MNYRSLLVLLDTDALCTARVQFAIRLAQSFECPLLGLVATQAEDDPADLVAQRFLEACAAAGLESFDIRFDEADVAESLVRAARCSDLCVLTQVDPADRGAMQSVLEQAVLRSARPMLILPYAGHPERLGSRAMVAWDNSREAARAVCDALPLLRRARRVDVLHLDETRNPARQAMRRSLDELQRWLARHGILAQVRVEAGGIDTADAMLSRAADLGSDLIVMGAAGHARWSPHLLGGATRGLLGSMTVPVLMSH